MILKPTAESLKAKFESLKPRNFEEYMGYVFFEEEPESVGDKDTFEDNLDRWISTLEASDVLNMVYKYEHKTF